MTADTSQTWYWDTWWRDGVKASCLEGPGGGYSGETERRWKSIFSTLPKGASVLDVCTGNGAVAAIAARTSHERGLNLDITAMDQAKIDPPKFVRGDKALKKITFLAERDVQDSGLNDASYDLVTSQYGVEYADLDRALPELARLTAPGGQICLALHAQEGSPVADAHQELDHCAFILDELDLFTTIGKGLDALAMPLSGTRMPDAVVKVRNMMGRLAERCHAYPRNLMLDNTWKVLNHALANAQSAGTKAVRDKTTDVETGVLSHRERTCALIEAALDRSGCEAAISVLNASGLTDIQLEPFEHLNPRRQVAWWISARKPG